MASTHTSSVPPPESTTICVCSAWLYVGIHCVLYALWFGYRTGHFTHQTGTAPTLSLTMLCATYGMALVAAVGAPTVWTGGLLLRWHPTPWMRRVLTTVLVLLHAALFLAVFIDTRVYDLLGVHLDSPWIRESLNNEHVAREMQLGSATWQAVSVLASVVILSETILLWVCHRSLRTLQKRSPTTSVRLKHAAMVLATIAFVATAWLRVLPPQGAEGVRDGLLGYESILGPHTFEAQWKQVQYPLKGSVSPTLSVRRPVVFVLVESFRADHLNKDLTPNLWQLTQDASCWQSPRHYSTAHTTELGTFAMLYGLYPYHYKPFSSEQIAPQPLTVLRDSGYTLAGASASQLRGWNQADFMVDPLDHYVEFLQKPAYTGDAKTIDWAKQFVTQHDKSKPYFLFLFLNAPHHNYHYPPEFERFTPAMDADYDHFLGDDKLEKHREAIHNRYRNSLLYVDDRIGDLLQFLDAQPGLKPIVAITGDHGEEFWDHGLLGHGASHFNNERIQVPLVLCTPDATVHPDHQLSSHVDLWPTVFDVLDGPQPSVSPPSTYSDGASLLMPPLDPMVFVGGTTFPYANPLACLIDNDNKIWLRLCGGDAFCVRPTKVTNANDEVILAPTELVNARIQRLETNLQRFVTLTP